MLKHLPVQIPILNGLADVVVADRIGLFQIRERPCDAQDFVVSARAEAELINRALQQRLRAGRERAEFAGGRRIEMRVAREGPAVARTLHVAHAPHSFPHFRTRRPTLARARDLVVAQRGHFHVQVDAIEKWS